MRGRLLPIALAAFVLISAAGHAQPRAVASVCGGLVGGDYRFADGGSSVTIVTKRGLTCGAARAVARACAVDLYPPRGWSGTLSRSALFAFLRAPGRYIKLLGVAGGPPACASPAPRHRGGVSHDPGVLAPRGLTAVRVGATPAQAERASGLYFDLEGAPCRRSLAVRGVAIEAGRTIAAVVVTARAAPTAEGVRVGDTAARLRLVYGDALTDTGSSQAGGRRLSYRSPDPAQEAYRVVFWTNRFGRIALMAAGRASDVNRRDEFCA
jgi:hypothetical protein